MTQHDAAADDDSAVRVLAEYYTAFSTLQVQAVLPYFHEPSLFISPQGVFAAPTLSEVTTVFAGAMEGLRAREFGRSELSVGSVKRLSSTAALVTGVAIRYQRSGQELERVGVTYALHKASEVWKIAVIILHDAEQS